MLFQQKFKICKAKNELFEGVGSRARCNTLFAINAASNTHTAAAQTFNTLKKCRWHTAMSASSEYWSLCCCGRAIILRLRAKKNSVPLKGGNFPDIDRTSLAIKYHPRRMSETYSCSFILKQPITNYQSKTVCSTNLNL